MATVNSTQYAAAHVTEPNSKLRPDEMHGRIRTAYAKYSAPGAIALNDVIRMFKLPKNARIVDAILKTSDLGTVGSLDVGWDGGSNSNETADADGIFDGVDVNTAAAVNRIGVVPGLFKRFDDEVTIQILAAAATDAAGDIELHVSYVID